MVYGAEAVLPSDREFDSPSTVHYIEEENELNRQNGLDALDEERDRVLSRTTIYQQGLRHYHSLRVKSRSFREVDLVLRLIQRTTGQHKLAPPWEGPFVVSNVLGNDSYYLIDICDNDKSITSEEETKRPWNISLLRPFYT